MWIDGILHDSYSILENIFLISLIMSIAKIFIAENQSVYYILYIKQLIKFLEYGVNLKVIKIYILLS